MSSQLLRPHREDEDVSIYKNLGLFSTHCFHGFEGFKLSLQASEKKSKSELQFSASKLWLDANRK